MEDEGSGGERSSFVIRLIENTANKFVTEMKENFPHVEHFSQVYQALCLRQQGTSLQGSHKRSSGKK